MTKDKELLPCPFCGSGNTEIANIFYLKAIRGQCADCGASAPIEAWNARATPDLPQHTGLCPLCDQRAEEDAKPSWRCFHCDEVFNDFPSARAHFGLYQNQKPACTIDEKEYRRMEFLHLSHMEEDTALHRIIAGLESKHQAALQREEEKGYSRGLHDSPDGWQLVPVIALSRAATMLAALGHKAVADDLLSAAHKEQT